MKNGTYINKNAGRMYIRISAGPQRNQYVHRLVLEAKLGRGIRRGFQAHHINGNTLDNRPENLQEIETETHARYFQWQKVQAQKYKEVTRKCIHLCPSCARICVHNADHIGAGVMHKCGLHEWAYARRGSVKIIITDIDAEEKSNGVS